MESFDRLGIGRQNVALPAPAGKTIVEFRAGKMTKTDKTVKPDVRKGKVVVVEDNEGIIHFRWLERPSERVEDDLYVFPDDAEWKKVKASSSRVYVLRFKSSDQRRFFWMQEPSDVRDNEISALINSALSGETEERLEETHESRDTQGTLLSMFSEAAQRRAEQQRQQQQAGGASSSSPATGDRLDLNYLSSVLSNIPGAAGSGGVGGDPAIRLGRELGLNANTNTTNTSTTATGGDGDAPSYTTNTNTNTAKQNRMIAHEGRVSLIQRVLQYGEKEKPQLVESLNEFLPELHPDLDTNAALLSSPQFRQVLSSFLAALHTGELEELMRQFGLPPVSSVDQLLEALEKLDESKSQKKE